MKAFRFPLDRALEWRRTELEQAEMRFKQQLAAMAEAERQRAEAEAADLRTEIEVRAWQPISGGDLAALESFRTGMLKHRRILEARRAECGRALADRQREMLEAQRRLRLLERLKERRFAEWRAECDREIERDAAEAFLAKWERQ